MFETMIFILITSFWVTLILGTILNFISRVVIVLSDTYQKKEVYYMLLLPFSYGIFKYAKESRYKKIHRILIIVLAITAILASLFLFYMNAEVGIY